MHETRSWIEGPPGLSGDTKEEAEGAASTQAEKMDAHKNSRVAMPPLCPSILSFTNLIKTLFLHPDPITVLVKGVHSVTGV